MTSTEASVAADTTCGLPDQWLAQAPEALAQLAPLQWLDWPELAECGVTVGVKREDLLHPMLGGNKLYKLYYHLHRARELGYKRILSFGGAWSNHLYALAAAGQSLGLETTGVVRGEQPAVLSAMLEDAVAMGMTVRFVSRSEYRAKASTAFMAGLRAELGDFYAIPEGGGDLAGARGCRALGVGLATLWQQQRFDVLCCAVGTGGTLAGVIAGFGAGLGAGSGTASNKKAEEKVPQNVKVCGFSVLKGPGSLAENIATLVSQLAGSQPTPHWCLETAYHGGGYARLPEELAQFMLRYEQALNLPLDPVYTAKMLWGVRAKALAGDWPRGTRVVLLHSGGLQGRRGFSGLTPLRLV